MRSSWWNGIGNSAVSHNARFSDIKRSQFGRIMGFITDEESSSFESDEVPFPPLITQQERHLSGVSKIISRIRCLFSYSLDNTTMAAYIPDKYSGFC